MSAHSTELVQRWMKTVVVGAGDLDEKARRAWGQFGLRVQDVVVGSERLTAETRLGIYTTGYMLRLLECMEADLPALYAYLGEDLFVMFAKAYLIEHPSQSYSLFELSRGFADFLARTRPGNDSMDEATNAAYDLPAELARVERGRLEAMRSKGTEDRAAATILPTLPFFSGTDVVVEPHPCLQLLHLKMPLADFYWKLLRNEKPDLPQASDTFMAIGRIRYRMQMHEIHRWQWRLLESLKNAAAPQPLSAALRLVSGVEPIAFSRLLADTSLWLPVAIDSGFLIETCDAQITDHVTPGTSE